MPKISRASVICSSLPSMMNLTFWVHYTLFLFFSLNAKVNFFRHFQYIHITKQVFRGGGKAIKICN